MIDYMPATRRATTPPPGTRARAAHVARVDAQLAAGIRSMARDLDRVVAKLYVEKAGFTPDQPRVPAHNPDGGQWVGANSGRQASGDAEVIRLAAAIDYSNALTGFSDIDETTRQLSELLGTTMEEMQFIPEATPQIYGTAVHVAFAVRVRLAGLPGIGVLGVEQSFLGGDSANRAGLPGIIRTDVVYRRVNGSIAAIYDVKTGGAALSPARVREIRQKTGVDSSVPIIELQVLRGASLKSTVVTDRSIGMVLARLWDTSLEGIPDPAAGRDTGGLD